MAPAELTTPPPMILCTDLDRTLTIDDKCRSTLPSATVEAADTALAEFNRVWLEEFRSRGAQLCYSTGRSLPIYEELVRERGGALLSPDVLITADGTSVHWRSAASGELEPDLGWQARLDDGWDKPRVLAAFRAEADVTAHCDAAQLETLLGRETPHRVSTLLQCDEATAARVVEALEAAIALPEAVDVFYCRAGRSDASEFWVGCTPRLAGKGHALEHVLAALSEEGPPVVVAGDSGNDKPMFTLCSASRAVRGIVVGNAFSELVAHCRALPCQERVHYAEGCYAGGLLEGLRSFALMTR